MRAPMSAADASGMPELLSDKVVEAIFVRALDGQIPRTALARLRELGLDLGRPLRPAYPMPVVEAALAAVAQSLSPGRPAADAHRELGRRVVLGFRETWRGRALVHAGRVLGPARVLEKLRTQPRSATVPIEILSAGRNDAELESRLVLAHPEFLVGGFEAVLEVLHGRGGKVELLDRGAPTRLKLTWR